MTCRMSRFIFQRFMENTVTRRPKSSPVISRSFFRAHNNSNNNNNKYYNSKTFPKFRVPATNLILGVAGVAGVAGMAWHLRHKPSDAPELWAVKAAGEASPCGDKPMAHRSAGAGSKGRIKVPGPCKKKSRCAEPQPNVISGLKKYSLFLWITLEPDADPCAVACAAAQIEEAIAATKGFDCDVDDEILAGVGFGPNFLSQNCLSPCKSFCYRSRKGKRGEMPCSNGDIFVHAKADSLGQLFDFCKIYLKNFPDESVSEFEDLYG